MLLTLTQSLRPADCVRLEFLALFFHQWNAQRRAVRRGKKLQSVIVRIQLRVILN